MNNRWGLTPRKYKGGDWLQHVDPNKRKQRKEQYLSSEQDEYNQLADSIKDAKDLVELEKVYQKVQNDPLYDSNKKSILFFTDSSRTPEDNKTELDAKCFNRLIDLFRKTNSLTELENN